MGRLSGMVAARFDLTTLVEERCVEDEGSGRKGAAHGTVKALGFSPRRCTSIPTTQPADALLWRHT